ncbi:transporter, betaine/carnitine/choline family [Propionibacterium acidifaciens F0233]|uniref:Transporter, betaine/carnitine/choline family n=1 Tax=Propionibacterium acidifaciens F0233 TaxID=553198 RepID=U2RIU3_9ACTN|nr:choline BCCT transporter BetT [Propionibacterium acidifaciens]ERK50657.1 transporter, betaine/carnitine/choline family [Propionibacterium acidifaciens F0233]
MTGTGHRAAARTDRPPVRWPVFITALSITGLVAAWCLAAPEFAGGVLGKTVSRAADRLGWFYIALATAALLFVIHLGLRYPRVRLGGDYDRPEYSTFSWAAMLFAAGIGTDLMFYAVAEPAAQFLSPPQIPGGTVDAARQSTVWAIYHYGITGWGMYALMGLALGYFAHRKKAPLAVRSVLAPLFGKRVRGLIGHSVDIATVIGTIFGVATSLGIGVVMLNVGLNILFGIPQGLGAQTALVVLAVVLATISATTGVDKGIRSLSQLNVALAVVLAGWALFTGNTTFLLRSMVMNIGDFVTMFPGMTLDTMAYDYPAGWMQSWTLFFWAWWIAWSAFVGMFLARISKGRTIGQFVLGTLMIPFSYIVMWISIFGNSAVKRIMDGDAAFGQAATASPEQGFFQLLTTIPGTPVLIALSTFVGLLFYVTSADSGALVMANLCSELPAADTDARPSLRILWAAATGILTIGMLMVGGIPALQSATIIMAIPFALVLMLVMVGLDRALREEHLHEQAVQRSFTAQWASPETAISSGSWRRRLSLSLDSVSSRQAEERLQNVIRPALDEVAEALQERGVPAVVREVSNGLQQNVSRRVQLEALSESEDGEDFVYPVQIRRSSATSCGARTIGTDDVTIHLEVAFGEGLSYNIYPYECNQICNDVLDHYERYELVAASRQEEATLQAAVQH